MAGPAPIRRYSYTLERRVILAGPRRSEGTAWAQDAEKALLTVVNKSLRRPHRANARVVLKDPNTGQTLATWTSPKFSGSSTATIEILRER